MSFIILGIGIIFLLSNLGLIKGPVWSIIWPVILIIIGLGGILKGDWRRKRVDK